MLQSYQFLTHLFQFTRPQGARQCENGLEDAAAEFQFTRPQGARRSPP